MTIGKKIAASRKKKGLTCEALGHAVGLSASAISKIENDKFAGGPAPEMVIKIAAALDDRGILLHYLRVNPVYQEVIPPIFSELNCIKTDPSAVLEKLEEEQTESLEAIRILKRMFTHVDPLSLPNARETILACLEQVLDPMRGTEIAFMRLIEAGIITEADRTEIHRRQQAKCERNGHHRPEMERV
jgi:transcriptional regulator with XRE-family HTH domain